MTPTYLALLFTLASQANALPEGLLSALCYVETAHNPVAVNAHDGGSASIGICQIKLSTARLLGFTGNAKALAEPATNIYWAARYLGAKMKRYQGNIVKAVAAYNAGTHRYNRNGLTMNRKYVSKVFERWAVAK